MEHNRLGELPLRLESDCEERQGADERVSGTRAASLPDCAPHHASWNAERTRPEEVTASRDRSILTRRRFQFAGAIAIGALLPWATRAPLPGTMVEAASLNTLLANALAVIIAFWMRLSIETYPGTRRSYVLLPSVLTGHGIMVAWFVFTRVPYDRLAISLGFVLHVVWLYALHIYAERRVRRRIAIVPFGAVERLKTIDCVDWLTLSRPRQHDARGCHAIVADFSADLPAEWQGFLAEAAIKGRMVYQLKQLSESLTGRVELEHLSENSFGSLLPARGYFYVKGLLDFLGAVAFLPLAMPLMAVIAIAIRLESRGPALFRQSRIGHARKRITVYKFRTMRDASINDERQAAMTTDGDLRITRIGGVLRKTRLDELPQVFNILKWEMGWIGPRPEAEVLSAWYAKEIPFYGYRHVVKPGISGWAQVNQGHVTDVGAVHEKLQFDFYYIKYFSPWLDLLIFFRTFKTILTGSGAR